MYFIQEIATGFIKNKTALLDFIYSIFVFGLNFTPIGTFPHLMSSTLLHSGKL